MLTKGSEHCRQATKRIRHLDVSRGKILVTMIEKKFLHSNMQRRKETERCIKGTTPSCPQIFHNIKYQNILKKHS